MHKTPLLLSAGIALGLLAALIACEPVRLQVTPQVIIITSEPTATPVPTATPALTRTPIPTPTDVIIPTATPIPCVVAGGEVLPFDDFESAVADETLRYRVYIPPCYWVTQKRYPVVYLLHGANATESQWDELGVDETLDAGIRDGSLPPMIVVMPYLGVIGNENLFPPDPSFETVLLEELMPAIERDFCTWNERADRAIGGISRGGFWAFSIALRHPDLFGTLGGHSAFFDSDIAPPPFDPLDLALNDPALENPGFRIYLDNGASDLVGTNLELFSSRLSARGITHTYVINPVGGHDDAYWSAHVSDYLAFYGRDWPKDTDDLPSCLEPSP